MSGRQHETHRVSTNTYWRRAVRLGMAWVGLNARDAPRHRRHSFSVNIVNGSPVRQQSTGASAQRLEKSRRQHFAGIFVTHFDREDGGSGVFAPGTFVLLALNKAAMGIGFPTHISPSHPLGSRPRLGLLSNCTTSEVPKRTWMSEIKTGPVITRTHLEPVNADNWYQQRERPFGS